MDDQQGDICRVCRCEAQSDRPLFYPCICTGSIKYIHQDCLMQWMRYSHKEYCELCGHRFSFQPIYSPDMPRVLPLRDVAGGLLSAIVKATKSWFHYSLVGLAWFGVVPLSAYRTYRYLFRASTFDMILSLPFDVFSTENLFSDAFRGCFVVTCTLLCFVGLVWIREQILHGGGPDWLEHDEVPAQANDLDDQVDGAAGAGAGGVNLAGGDDNDNGANDDNNNGDAAAPVDVPMDNAAPAPDDPEEPEFEPLLGQARHLHLEQAAVAAAGHGEQRGIGNNEQDIAADGGAIPDAAEAEDDANANAANDGGGLGGVIADNDNDNEEPNWNPMDWDRANEDLTWERLLGLDGSLVFLEHVFWIISMNTMFIFTFAFCPYCIGNFILRTLDLLQPEKPLMHFHGLITTLFGYCCIGMTLVVLHFFARVLCLRRVRWFLGLCYIVVKVSLLSVVEIGVLPLVCGWWLDICSLPLFDASIKDRKVSFKAAPGTSLFVHWMFGMVYVYYFAAFISLLREVLRPGVLWFLRNLNDPDFSPIQEMIHLPILRHVRRLIASAMIFGSAVLLILWLPIRILQSAWPTFLPYTLSGDAEVNELSLQLLLLQIILPGFFEQSHTRVWLKGVLRLWCVCVSWVLGIKSYLLGNMDQQAAGGEQQQPQPDNAAQAAPHENPEAQQQQLQAVQQAAEVQAVAANAVALRPQQPLQAERNLGAAHQAFMRRDVPVGFQPYDRPTFFALRLCGLLCFICMSLVVASLITITVPVTIGRQVMALWSLGGHITNAQTVATAAQAEAETATSTSVLAAAGGGQTEIAPRPHELYTAAVGTYLCWIVSRGIAIARFLLPQGRAAVIRKMRQWLQAGASYAVPALIFVLMLGVIPLLFGLLLELVVLIPLRVPLYQTPVHFFGQDWALGVLYTKIAIALTLMGPDWHLKRAIERAYRDGLRDIDLKFLIRDLATPVIMFFGLALAIPYVIAHSIMPIFFDRPVRRLEIARASYPAFFIIVGIIVYIYFEINQFKKLYVAIKVDKYLVGQRLVNYEHRKRKLETDGEANGDADTEYATDATSEAEAGGEGEGEGEVDGKENRIPKVPKGNQNVSAFEQARLEQQRRQAAAAFAAREALVNDELL